MVSGTAAQVLYIYHLRAAAVRSTDCIESEVGSLLMASGQDCQCPALDSLSDRPAHLYAEHGW